MAITNELKVQGSDVRSVKYVYRGLYKASEESSYKPNDVYYKETEEVVDNETIIKKRYYIVKKDAVPEEVEIYPALDKAFDGNESLSSASLNEALNSSYIITASLNQFFIDKGLNQNNKMEDILIDTIKKSYRLVKMSASEVFNLIYDVNTEIQEDTSALKDENNNYGKKIIFKVNNEEKVVLKANEDLIIKEVKKDGKVVSGKICHRQNNLSSQAASTYYVQGNSNYDNYWNFSTYIPYIKVNKYGHITEVTSNVFRTPTKPYETIKEWDGKKINKDWLGNYVFTVIIENSAELLTWLRNMSSSRYITLEIVMCDKDNESDTGSIYINGYNFTFNSVADEDHKINDWVRYRITYQSGGSSSSSYGGSSSGSGEFVASLSVDGFNYVAPNNNTDQRNSHVCYRTKVKKVIFHRYHSN